MTIEWRKDPFVKTYKVNVTPKPLKMTQFETKDNRLRLKESLKSFKRRKCDKKNVVQKAVFQLKWRKIGFEIFIRNLRRKNKRTAAGEIFYTKIVQNEKFFNKKILDFGYEKIS